MRPQVDDVRLHVSVIGDEWRDGEQRPVMVALHGGPGVDASGLRFLMAPASEYAQVVIPDQRGHGHSDLSEPSRWNLDTWADDLAALIDVLGLSRPVVLGTSFGGFVVQRYLARHPDQPAGAVLLSTIPRAPNETETVERFRELGGEPAAEAMRRSFQQPTVETERQWEQVCAPLLVRRALSPAYEAATRHSVATTEVNLHFMPSLARMNLGPGLAAARCPVLVLAGEHDPLSPPVVVAEIVSALPAGLGELHVVRGASHRILWDAADTAHGLVRAFVERVTR